MAAGRQGVFVGIRPRWQARVNPQSIIHPVSEVIAVPDVLNGSDGTKTVRPGIRLYRTCGAATAPKVDQCPVGLYDSESVIAIRIQRGRR